MSKRRAGERGGAAPVVVATILALAMVGAAWAVRTDVFAEDDATTTTAAAVTSAPGSTEPGVTEPPSTTAAGGSTPTGTAATPPVAGQTVLRHASGAFEITVPDNGWQAEVDATSTSGGGAPIIRYSPNVADFANDVPGFAIADLTGGTVTPDQYVDNVNSGGVTTPSCQPTPPEPFSHAGFTGVASVFGPCAATAEFGALVNRTLTLGLTGPGGVQVGVVIKGEANEALALAALETLTRP